MTKEEWYKQLFERLENSKFRSSFHLKQKDIDYINEKGLERIRQHAEDFISKREAPASRILSVSGLSSHPVIETHRITTLRKTDNCFIFIITMSVFPI